MSREKNQKLNISQKVALFRNDKCLILKIAKYDNLWELPGGHVEKGETNTEALDRELKEELNFDNYENWGVIDYEIWYHGPDKYPVCGIVSYIKNDSEEIKISDEHTDMKWISKKEIKDHDFLWPAAKRMIKKAFDIHKSLK